MSGTVRRVALASLALIAASAVAIPAFARRSGHPLGLARRLAALESFGEEPLLLRELARKLDLSGDQKKEIRGILEDHWKSGLRGAADTARRSHRDLRHTIQDPKADDAAILAACRGTATADEKLALARHETATDVLAVLAPEQRQKAQSLRDDLERLGDEIFERVDSFLSRS